MSKRHRRVPPPLELTSMKELLEWYLTHLCTVRVIDPRGYRVRFRPENFVHLILIKNKYGEEPRNAHLTLREIEKERICFTSGRYDQQRAREISWARTIAENPDFICGNWQALGTGNEAYVRNLGSHDTPQHRVLICKVIGTVRQAITIFPRERIGEKESFAKIWP